MGGMCSISKVDCDFDSEVHHETDCIGDDQSSNKMILKSYFPRIYLIDDKNQVNVMKEDVMTR